MSKQKIDELLGIPQGIDDFLDTLSVDNVTDQFKTIDNDVKLAISNIDSQLSTYNLSEVKQINLQTVEASLNDIHSLIESSKKVIKHVYETIVTSELVDSELVHSFSVLLESSHVIVSEYIQMYKDRLAFVDKIKLKMFEQEQKKELLMMKHRLDMEKLQAKADQGAIDVDLGTSYKQEDIIKMIDAGEI